MPSPLLTTNDVAARLNVHRLTVTRLRLAGELVAVLVGRSVRFTPESVEAFIADHAETHVAA